MGNSMSNNNDSSNKLKDKSMTQIIDYIATNYILTMDFKSLKKLYEKDYCDKMVILTSDIIKKYFSDLEITYLSQRIKNGVEVNEMEKDKIIFFNKDDLNKIDINNSVKKNRLCIGIAKFYIKIAHLFAAIVTTINPIYVYNDVEGNTVKVNLYEKDKIPTNVPRKIYKLNICENRINALKGNQDYNNIENNEINVQPKICSMNVNMKGEIKTLLEEPGMPELMDLYYDEYDYKSGNFIGMSNESKKMYESDLKLFYGVFTNNDSIPENIKKFSDIKLRDYHNTNACNGDSPLYKKNYKGSLKNKLFADYAKNIKNMIVNTKKNQEELLTIINKLFVYTIDTNTQKKQIIVNPELTEESLQKIVIETRGIIIKLYLTCEVDFVNGMKLYEAIVESQILESTKKQIESLEKTAKSLYSNEQIPNSAEELNI